MALSCHTDRAWAVVPYRAGSLRCACPSPAITRRSDHREHGTSRRRGALPLGADRQQLLVHRGEPPPRPASQPARHPICSGHLHGPARSGAWWRLTPCPQVSPDRLTVRYTGSASAGPRGHEGAAAQVGAVQANRPVPRHGAPIHYYWEATVRGAGERCSITIGFTDRHFKQGHQPGCALRRRRAAAAQAAAPDSAQEARAGGQWLLQLRAGTARPPLPTGASPNALLPRPQVGASELGVPQRQRAEVLRQPRSGHRLRAALRRGGHRRCGVRPCPPRDLLHVSPPWPWWCLPWCPPPNPARRAAVPGGWRAPPRIRAGGPGTAVPWMGSAPPGCPPGD